MSNMSPFRIALGLALATILANHALAADDSAPWSSSLNGLQARLVLVQKPKQFGTRWLVPYIELRNVRDLANGMEVPCGSRHLKIELVDAEGRPVTDALQAAGIGNRSGPHADLGTIVLPYDSSIRISLECKNWGIPKAAAMVSTDSGAWSITDSGKGKVFLRATLSAAKGEPEWKTWHGELQTPLLKIDWNDQQDN
jgi:hypothetical protein